MSNKGKKKRNGSKIALIVVLIVLLLLLLTAVCGFAVLDHYLGKINRTPSEVVDVIPPESEDFETDERESDVTELTPEEIIWPEENTSPNDDHLINILLVGQDRREGQGRQRSDSMILCSINVETKEIAMVSFLRDLYVQIPGGYADNRLNSAYAFGGFPLLDATLKHNFGITVDGNVEVDFSRFVQVIDSVGGVDLYLSGAEAEIVFGTYAEGYYHLDGERALVYSRIRYIDNDFNRTGRQRNVLTAVFNKVKTMNLNEMLSLLDAILPSLTTDMTNTEIISTATKLFPLLANTRLTSNHVPSSDAYYSAYVNGMSVLVPDLELNRKHLYEDYLPIG